MERKRTPASLVPWAVVLPVDGPRSPGVPRRPGDTRKNHRPGHRRHEGSDPRATVTVTDPARNTTVTSTTNEQGLFQVNYLLPGTYTVTVELTGFKKYVQDNVVLQMTETRDLPVVLEVGALEESVSVIAEVADW